MADRPLVSVLLPTTGRSRFLPAALTSLLRQDHSRWELVVVLDGGASPLLDRQLSELPDVPVRLVRTGQRQGVAHALNTGLAVCEGDLVARLDDDDECEPERLSRQVRAMLARPALAVLGTGSRDIDADGNVVRHVPVPTGTALRRRMTRQNALVHPSVMLRAGPVHEVGGYPQRLRRVEDYALWLALLGRYEIDNLAAPLLRRRVHPGQHSRGRPRREDLRRIAQLQAEAGRRTGRTRAQTLAGSAWWLTGQLTGVVRYRVLAR